MSVILYSPQELARVNRLYQSINPGTYEDAPTTIEMETALGVYHLANVMAYCLTYADCHSDGSDRFQDLGPACDASPVLMPRPLTPKVVIRHLRLMMYNSISNGGTECMPQSYQDTFKRAIRAITDKLLGLYTDEVDAEMYCNAKQH